MPGPGPALRRWAEDMGDGAWRQALTVTHGPIRILTKYMLAGFYSLHFKVCIVRMSMSVPRIIRATHGVFYRTDLPIEYHGQAEP